jgi:hypothetical protein
MKPGRPVLSVPQPPEAMTALQVGGAGEAGRRAALQPPCRGLGLCDLGIGGCRAAQPALRPPPAGRPGTSRSALMHVLRPLLGPTGAGCVAWAVWPQAVAARVGAPLSVPPPLDTYVLEGDGGQAGRRAAEEPSLVGAGQGWGGLGWEGLGGAGGAEL